MAAGLAFVPLIGNVAKAGVNPLFGAAVAKGVPNPKTGAGFGVTAPPVRVLGAWTEADFKAALLQGKPPVSLGHPDLHHAGQMPGSAIHEILPLQHRGNPALHPTNIIKG